MSGKGNQPRNNSQDQLSTMSNQQFIRYLAKNYKSPTELYTSSKSPLEVSDIDNYSRLSLGIKRKIDFDYHKTSPIPQLRLKEKIRKHSGREKFKNLRNINILKDEIEENKNVFMNELLSKVPNMEIQNILWEKNYILKNSINALKEENSSLKARAWNIAKQNRKMKKQIQSWNLEKSMIISPNKKPYIDSTTMEKVYQDQDFSVVSMKIELNQLNKVLEEKEEIIKVYEQKIYNFEDHLASLNNDLMTIGKKYYREVVAHFQTEPVEKILTQYSQKIARNDFQIKDLQKSIQDVRQQKKIHQEQLNSLRVPPRKYTQLQVTQMKQSIIAVKQVEEEPMVIIERQVKKANKQVEQLEIKMQQVINECLITKQNKKRKMKQLQKNIESVQKGLTY